MLGEGFRNRAGFLIAGLTTGHGVFHWFTQSLITMLPEIQAAFGLSGVAVGGITSTRELVSGLVTLPAGIIVDSLRKYWGLVLAFCMAGFGLGWVIIGLSAHYWVLLVGMAVVALAAAIWHLPAAASLSYHFSERKGTVLSFHGVGGQIGDALAPPVTGILLGFMVWREIISIYVAIPIGAAFIVYWAFKYIGRLREEDSSKPFHRDGQIRTTKRVMSNPTLWLLALTGGIRGMGFLGMSPLVRSIHLGLLMAVGIVSTPIVGYLSDLYGRKRVLVPGLLLLAVYSFALGSSGDGIVLVVLIALMGTFLFGDQPVITAWALDIAGHEVATTVLGILNFERFILGATSPLIAGYIYDNHGSDLTFSYVAVLFAMAALILCLVRSSKASH